MSDQQNYTQENYSNNQINNQNVNSNYSVNTNNSLNNNINNVNTNINQNVIRPEFLVKPNKFVAFFDAFVISLIPFLMLYVFFLVLKKILQIDVEYHYMLLIQFILAICVIIFMILSYGKKSGYKVELYDNYMDLFSGKKLVERINYVFITSISYDDDLIDKIFKTNSIKINEIVAIRHIKQGDKFVQFVNYLYQYNMRYYRG
ncbi:MAG: hypothetical protein PHT94_00050 [Candidatus Nanoarchaeia archaeon]|nr:hypothetical protein [Candidatus Nanoarchaeia archaeon]